MISKNNNNYPFVNGDNTKFVRVSKRGYLIAFKTVNSDWCVINTKMDTHKGMYTVETEPFTSCKVMLMHISDFDNILPELKEIPVITKWPIPRYNDNGRSN